VAAPVGPTVSAAPKTEPVTPSLFAAPPSARPTVQPLPRHPAIPTQRPLSGAIRPILAPSVPTTKTPPANPAPPAEAQPPSSDKGAAE